jgi:hypothetical protein
VTTEIFVINFEEKTKIAFKGRFESAQKRELIEKLISLKTTQADPKIIADDIGIITDLANVTTIQTKARIYLEKHHDRKRGSPPEIFSGETAKLAIRGYGTPSLENAVICVRKIQPEKTD